MDASQLFRKAKRKNLHLKLLLGGPSGAGKTYSSLLLAKGFQGSLDKVVVIDTEDSADVYDRLGGYSVVDFKPPFDPRRLVKLIDISIEQGFEFIIIDSATKFWDGEGGALDIHAAFGGKFQDWAKVTPIWDKMLQKLVHCEAHVISCTRKKQEYAMESDGKKARVQKMGLKNITREGYEYEFTTALDIDMSHNVTVNKDRTGIFEEICPVILKEEHGKMLKNWCEGK